MLNLMLHLACCSKLSRLCTDEADAVSILQRFAACVPSSWEALCEAVPNCNALCLCMLKGMCRA